MSSKNKSQKPLSRAPVALITGAAHRLGRAMALHLATSHGYDIALHYAHSKQEALDTQKQILNSESQNRQQCQLFQADFTQVDQIENLMQQTLSRFKHIDVLINNASLYKEAPLLSSTTTDNHLQKTFAINVFAPLILSRAMARASINSNIANVADKLIINILDNKILHQQYEYFGYVLSKKSLAQATPLLAMELAPHIRVNAISPGVILPATDRSTEDYLQYRRQGIALKKIGAVENILQGISYLIRNRFVSGEILTVDGGEALAAQTRNYVAYKQLKHKYIISLGSNIEPVKNLAAAETILKTEQHWIQGSRIIETKPVGFQQQPDFLNCAAIVTSRLDYQEFRKYLKQIEKRLGRVKTAIKSGPRTIDLDIIYHNEKLIDADGMQNDYVSIPVAELLGEG